MTRRLVCKLCGETEEQHKDRRFTTEDHMAVLTTFDICTYCATDVAAGLIMTMGFIKKYRKKYPEEARGAIRTRVNKRIER